MFTPRGRIEKDRDGVVSHAAGSRQIATALCHPATCSAKLSPTSANIRLCSGPFCFVGRPAAISF
eukprot:6009797-Prorocentrum_lima.AAC.1